MSESLKPRKTKAELEQIVKSNGGKILQSEHAAPNTVCVADRGDVCCMSIQPYLLNLLQVLLKLHR